MGGGAGMHRPHLVGQRGFGRGPHQVHVAVATAQFQRIGRVAAEVQQRPAGLPGPRRVGRQALELVDLALVVDAVLRPGLLQDLDHLMAAAVAAGAIFDLAGKVRRDDVDGEPALQHVVERGDGARQHGRLHLTAAHGGEQVHALRLRRHGGGEAQRVLPHLERRRAQDVAEAQRLGAQHHVTRVGVAAAQAAFRHTEVAEIVRAQGGEPGDLDRVQSFGPDGHSLLRHGRALPSGE